jgi:TRAP-type C4-dicarboxylate transport system substrate-binding protein
MTIFNALLAALLALPGLARAEGPVRYIKFATLAPQASTWMKVMDELNKELQERSGGSLRFKMYPGGVAGDEKDVVRKMRIGEIQAAGFTGVGIGSIAPEVRLFDSPWLFRNEGEIRALRKKLAGRLADDLKKGGMVLLGWVDPGFVYFFTRDAVQSPENLKNSKFKMWVWVDDPIAQAAYRAIDVSPVPLSIIDVMSSLETGLVNGVYGPPLGVIALEWFTRTNYIYPVPVAYSAGAVLIARRFFDSLTPAQKKLLVSLSRKHLDRLNVLSGQEAAQSLKTLESRGLKMGKAPSAADLAYFEAAGPISQKTLVSQGLFSSDIVKEADSLLQSLRRRGPQRPSKPSRGE